MDEPGQIEPTEITPKPMNGSQRGKLRAAINRQQSFTPKQFAEWIRATDGACFFLSPTEVKSRLKDKLFIRPDTVERLMNTPEFAAEKEDYKRRMDDKFWALLSHWVETNLKSKTPSLREGAEILGEVTNQYKKGKTQTRSVSDEQKKVFTEVLKKLNRKSA